MVNDLEGAREAPDDRPAFQARMKAEMDRLPMKVKYQAVLDYARIVTGQRVGISTLPLVFARLRRDLSNGVIPEWMPMSWERPQAVITHDGLLWYVKQDLHRNRRGVIVRIEVMPK